MVNKTLMEGGASDDESEGHYYRMDYGCYRNQYGSVLGLAVRPVRCTVSTHSTFTYVAWCDIGGSTNGSLA